MSGIGLPGHDHPQRRAAVVGTGLIGGSVGLALRALDWHVTGTDEDAPTLARALERGAIDVAGVDPRAELTVIATPVGSVAQLARQALERGGVVTDVGSVKAPVVAAVEHPCFVGGHPMAGSEALGIEGARADLFQGATWALTPSGGTDADAISLVHGVIRSMGAQVAILDPQTHDRLVATVSHVPHLTAAALMGVAAARSTESPALKRLAAGGFRDMTRIAAGDPRIWLDICNDNRDAICEVLDGLVDSLSGIRSIVAEGRTDELAEMLADAQTARRSLPTGAPMAEELVEVRVEVTDRPGELAAVTTMATEADINVYDIEVVHAAGGAGAMLVLVVAKEDAEQFLDRLERGGRAVGIHPLGDA